MASLLPNTHVITVDYRGFGKSSGSPTEAGLITDGVALVNWAMDVAGIPSERIVLLGQSLGTAVASAVALHFVDPKSELLLAKKDHAEEEQPLLNGSHAEAARPPPTTLAGVVLVAPFSSLPSLMLTYRIGGFFPVLMPLRPFPAVAGMITSRMVDKWQTAERLASYYSTLASSPADSLSGGGRRMGTLQIIHATNDMDISFHQTEMICQRMLGDKCVLDASEGRRLQEVRDARGPRVRLEIVEYGGMCRSIASMFR